MRWTWSKRFSARRRARLPGNRLHPSPSGGSRPRRHAPRSPWPRAPAQTPRRRSTAGIRQVSTLDRGQACPDVRPRPGRDPRRDLGSDPGRVELLLEPGRARRPGRFGRRVRVEPGPGDRRLQTDYAYLGQGEVTVTTPLGAAKITYQEAGRAADVEFMADAAMRVGHTGDPIDDAVYMLRSAIDGRDRPDRGQRRPDGRGDPRS